MSLHQIIATDARSYVIAPDTTSEYRVLVAGTVRDAVSGAAITSALRVVAAHENVHTKVMDNSIFCAASDPLRAFPQGASASGTLDLTFRAEGYEDSARSIPIPANTQFPVYLPAPVLLDPLPTRIQGRVMTNSLTPTPIANALVTIVDPTATPDHVLVLRSPLQQPHAANTPIRERPLTPTGTVKHLNAPVAAGSALLFLDQRAGLAVNSVLQIGTGSAVEYGVIASVNPVPANPNLPGEVTLRMPLTRSFPAGAPVTAVTVGAVGASSALRHPHRAGEALLILNSAITAAVVEIADANPTRVEYHSVGARTSADGYYALSGIGRVVTARVRAESGASNATHPVRLDYVRRTVTADFAL